MIRKILLIAISISAYLAFQRSWLFLLSLPVALFFGYEQYVRAKMLEYRGRVFPGKVKNQAIFLPYLHAHFAIFREIFNGRPALTGRPAFCSCRLGSEEALRRTAVATHARSPLYDKRKKTYAKN